MMTPIAVKVIGLSVDWVHRFDRIDEVPDPYYGGCRGFEHVMDFMEDGCHHLLEELKSKLS